MTCYKFVSVDFRWFGLQAKVESFILGHYQEMLLALHQHIWCWMDKWQPLTLEEMHRIEEETKRRLDAQIKDNKKRGINFE